MRNEAEASSLREIAFFTEGSCLGDPLASVDARARYGKHQRVLRGGVRSESTMGWRFIGKRWATRRDLMPPNNVRPEAVRSSHKLCGQETVADPERVF